MCNMFELIVLVLLTINLFITVSTMSFHNLVYIFYISLHIFPDLLLFTLHVGLIFTDIGICFIIVNTEQKYNRSRKNGECTRIH